MTCMVLKLSQEPDALQGEYVLWRDYTDVAPEKRAIAPIYLFESPEEAKERAEAEVDTAYMILEVVEMVGYGGIQ